MHLKIITPEKLILDEEVYSVTLPGAKGQMTILPGHTLLVSELTDGELYFRKNAGQGREQYKIGKGFVEVEKDNVTILATSVNKGVEVKPNV